MIAALLVAGLLHANTPVDAEVDPLAEHPDDEESLVALLPPIARMLLLGVELNAAPMVAAVLCGAGGLVVANCSLSLAHQTASEPVPGCFSAWTWLPLAGVASGVLGYAFARLFSVTLAWLPQGAPLMPLGPKSRQIAAIMAVDGVLHFFAVAVILWLPVTLWCAFFGPLLALLAIAPARSGDWSSLGYNVLFAVGWHQFAALIAIAVVAPVVMLVVHAVTPIASLLVLEEISARETQ